jgi:hypothetical protein
MENKKYVIGKICLKDVGNSGLTGYKQIIVKYASVGACMKADPKCAMTRQRFL